MENLATVVIVQIIEWLGPRSRRALRATCRRMRAVVYLNGAMIDRNGNWYNDNWPGASIASLDEIFSESRSRTHGQMREITIHNGQCIAGPCFFNPPCCEYESQESDGPYFPSGVNSTKRIIYFNKYAARSGRISTQKIIRRLLRFDRRQFKHYVDLLRPLLMKVREETRDLRAAPMLVYAQCGQFEHGERHAVTYASFEVVFILMC